MRNKCGRAHSMHWMGANVGCLGILYANSILNKNTKTFKYIYTNHSNPTKLVYLHFEVRSK